MDQKASTSSVGEDVKGHGSPTAGGRSVMSEKDVEVEAGQVLDVIRENGIPKVQWQTTTPAVRSRETLDKVLASLEAGLGIRVVPGLPRPFPEDSRQTPNLKTVDHDGSR